MLSRGRRPTGLRSRRDAVSRGRSVRGSWSAAALRGCHGLPMLTPMVKTQVYLPEDELKALHRVARRSKRSVADLCNTTLDVTRSI